MGQKSFIGKGEVFLGLADGSGALRSIGNCSSLVLNIEEETIEQKDYTNGSGGLANSISTISSIGAEMTLLDLSDENLALALRGTSAAISVTPVADEVQTAYKGGLVAFDKLPDTTQTITVQDDTDTTTYVEDTDYTVTRAGIIILEAGAIADSDVLHIDYTPLAGSVIEALTGSAQEYKLVFNGLNEAESGKPVILTVHRMKFTPAQGLGFITDEFAELPLTASILKNSNIVGAGLSQYMKIAQAA